ncbi:MAG: aconitate hydratase B, partial [Candidatus Aminicenantes bacterium]|nr:aconitate hydratase B [Candidatus Aminicenantes bacterium]
MLNSYFALEKERKNQGIPPLPLSPDQTHEVCRLLENPPEGKADILFELLSQRVSPGVDPAAKVKAEWLTKIAMGDAASPVVSKEKVVFLLGTMLGGYNVEPLIDFLENEKLASKAADALKKTILVYSAFD